MVAKKQAENAQSVLMLDWADRHRAKQLIQEHQPAGVALQIRKGVPFTENQKALDEVVRVMKEVAPQAAHPVIVDLRDFPAQMQPFMQEQSTRDGVGGFIHNDSDSPEAFVKQTGGTVIYSSPRGKALSA